ncbi:MAG: hypothetical protein N3B10_15115, partial [Armatimonadetes bacterium]|nr:hypothetical protein [Armatimonadota bacterium]
MHRWIIGLAITVAVITLMAIWFWRFSAPPDISEVRARILPIGWQGCFVTDLDGDGNDEIVVETQVMGWGNLYGRQASSVTAVTMRKGKFVTFPIPLSERLKTSTPKGRRLIGKTEKGDIAVAELLPNGKWRVQILLPRTMQGGGFVDYEIGDLDGIGQDDDVVVSMGTGGERIIWFRKLPDGRWMKVKEILLPTGKRQQYGLRGFTSYGVQALVWTGFRSFHLPLLFLDGKWEIGQFDEQVHLFEGDLDSDGQNEKALVRFLPMSDKVRWKVWSKKVGHYFEGTWEFKGWNVLSSAATNKFGDGQWHLLLAMAKDKPLTMRVLDCRFEPSKKWKVTELSRWKIVKVMPWHRLQIPDRVDLMEISDTDGDGQAEIVIATPWQGNWLLRRARERWVSQSLQFSKGQILLEHRPHNQIGDRLWFSRIFFERVSGKCLAFAELGTFDAQGQWKPIGKYQQSSFFIFREGRAWLEDLNSDCYPEILNLEGMIWAHPALYYRSPKGEWQKARLVGGSLFRELEVLLRGAGVGAHPSAKFFVQWERKNWFVVVWRDGFVQAITCLLYTS